jgi:hypothetical protein
MCHLKIINVTLNSFITKVWMDPDRAGAAAAAGRPRERCAAQAGDPGGGGPHRQAGALAARAE